MTEAFPTQPALAEAGREFVLSTHMLRPAPQRFPMSHAPFLAVLEPERIMLTWFSGSREWATDVGLLTATLHLPSATWSAPTLLLTEVMQSVGNSVAHRDVLGVAHLWYVRTARYWQDGEIVHVAPIQIDGALGPKSLLPLPPGWLIRGRPLEKAGRLHLPVYHETEMLSAVWEQPLRGEAGQLHEPIGAQGGLIHPVLLDLGESEFRFLFRNSFSPNRIHLAYSMNNGQTWSRPHPTALPNPNSGIDAVRLEGDILLCAYNHSQSDRSPLSLALSANRGIDWTRIADLENERGEFSYPSLLLHGEQLLLAYTHRRSAIKIVRLDRERLIDAAKSAC